MTAEQIGQTERDVRARSGGRATGAGDEFRARVDVVGVDVMLMFVGPPGAEQRPGRQIAAYRDAAHKFATVCRASGSPLLSRVDPEGGLVLTSGEMPQFMAELDAVQQVALAASERAALVDVGHLALLCSTNTATEIHLRGD